MSVDFAALTAAVGAGLSDVRACLIVSRDGLALGSYPPADEGSAMTKWSRLTSLGDVERGFAVVGEECWVFCSRGPYSALAVAKASARPGLILERLDQMVLAAEEARLRKEGLGSLEDPRDPAAAARRRRTSAPPTGVHPQPSAPSPRPPERIDVRPSASQAASGGRAMPAAPSQPSQPSQPSREVISERRADPAPAGAPIPQGSRAPGAPDAPRRQQGSGGPAGPEGKPGQQNEPEAGKTQDQRTLWVIDADDLTREFAGLLDDPEEPGRP
jgi:hypothetical protein